MTPVADELRPMLDRVRALRELLGEQSTPDCAYAINRTVIALSDLIKELEKGAKQ